MTYDVVPPDPAGTIESLSALGYSVESAVADIVDNSIDAEAKRVSVLFHWAGAESHVAVVDDGQGMSATQLQDAMAIARRGPRTDRLKDELGRFGMGLKTASFSQAVRLIVWTRQSDVENIRVWDLDRVVETQEWQLLHEPNEAGRSLVDQLKAGIKGSGTVVIWQGLTKIVEADTSPDNDEAHDHFLATIDRVEQHLALTFGRFLPSKRAGRTRRLVLDVNGHAVQAWDPFLSWHEFTMVRPVENLAIDGQRVTVRPFVLPAKRRLTDEQYAEGAGPRGWLEQQGFYVYRNDRLIVPGGWLDLPGFRSDEKHVLARIAVEIPSALDHLWSIDVKKATARPPLPLRGSLTRTAKATRAEAQRLLTAIGRVKAHEKSDDLSYVWRPERQNGDLRLRINWQHPLVKESLSSAGDGRSNVRALLKFIEETVPLAALRMMFDDEEDRDYQPFSGAPSDDVIDVAKRMFGAYVSQGLTVQQAKSRLKHTSPFDEFPDLLMILDLDKP